MSWIPKIAGEWSTASGVDYEEQLARFNRDFIGSLFIEIGKIRFPQEILFQRSLTFEVGLGYDNISYKLDIDTFESDELDTAGFSSVETEYTELFRRRTSSGQYDIKGHIAGRVVRLKIELTAAEDVETDARDIEEILYTSLADCFSFSVFLFREN